MLLRQIIEGDFQFYLGGCLLCIWTRKEAEEQQRRIMKHLSSATFLAKNAASFSARYAFIISSADDFTVFILSLRAAILKNNIKPCIKISKRWAQWDGTCSSLLNYSIRVFFSFLQKKMISARSHLLERLTNEYLLRCYRLSNLSSTGTGNKIKQKYKI